MSDEQNKGGVLDEDDERLIEQEIDRLGADAVPGTAQASGPDAGATAFHPSALHSAGEVLGDAEENMNMILDIPVSLSIEVGRTRIPIRNLLQLSQGSVVELDRVSGEPMDVLVNGTLIARGEVVVVNDKYGVRLTDIISHADRIRRLSS